MGYCLQQMQEAGKARDAFLALVRRHPDSGLASEAWMRIGEQRFDEDRLEEALDAYTRVVEHGEGPLYDRALYKQAWTHYRLDHFDQAIGGFMELVRLADGPRAGPTTGDLRPEAIQYSIVSISEEDWDGDGITDGVPIMDRVRLDLARLLVERGARVESKSAEGKTALMYAVHNRHYEVARFLRQQGEQAGRKSP